MRMVSFVLSITPFNMKYFITTIILLIAIFAVLSYGLERSERIECLKWQQQATESRLWYATAWQQAQCDHYGIELK